VQVYVGNLTFDLGYLEYEQAKLPSTAGLSGCQLSLLKIIGVIVVNVCIVIVINLNWQTGGEVICISKMAPQPPP